MVQYNLQSFIDEYLFSNQNFGSISNAVVFFGSARINIDSKYYDKAFKISRDLASKGYNIVTGGGPGIMEAANKGAKKSNANSFGFCIDLSITEPPNPYIDVDKSIVFKNLALRKLLLINSALAFICFPGGYGTLDELFECLTLIQN